MSDLETLYREIKRLAAEFDELMEERSKEHDRQADFAAIEELAGKTPLKNHALSRLDQTNQLRYLRLVCTAAGLDGEISTDQLLRLRRLAVGAGAAATPSDLLCMAYQTEHLEWQAAAINLKNAALPLLLDVMLVIHLAKRTPERGLDFAASLAALLECRAEDLEVTAKLASALLTQNFQAFKTIKTERAYPELGYAVPDQWLERTSGSCQTYELRKREKADCTNRDKFFTLFYLSYYAPEATTTAQQEFRNGDCVKARDALVSFSTTFTSPPRETDQHYKLPEYPPIRAPYSGIVWYCYVSDGKCEVLVTSPFDGDPSSISTHTAPDTTPAVSGQDNK